MQHASATTEPSTSERVIDAIRASARAPIAGAIEPGLRLVDDLGFDSLGIVTLSVALEDRFGEPILLDGWIASVSSPSALTVGSLSSWIDESLRGGPGAGGAWR